MYDIKSVAIIGGGTAGWFTALMIKNYYAHLDVLLIESEEIGILGAGEGTTPHFINLLADINISIDQVIKYADGTIKNGIKFENWNGDGKNYFHSFAPDSELNQIGNYSILSTQLSKHDNLLAINYPQKLTDEYKVPFIYGKKSTNLNSRLIDHFENNSNYALHFNARKLAKFFSEVGLVRGIRRIEGRVTELINDEQGYIRSIRVDNELNLIDTDFVFDCSGFARLCLGKHYNTEWESYEKYLPMNTAIPFFIPHNNNTTAETISTAMSSGWCWQIPVRDRYGCGYVFDSNFISEEQALKEAEEYFGQKLEVPKTFRFKAGSYKKALVKNCLAIGLSQGFIEPLEATSLWVSYRNLINFINLNAINSYKSEVFCNKYNNICIKANRDIRDFIYLHYLTKRNDSKFWQNFKFRHDMIPSVYEDIEIINNFSHVDMVLNNDLFQSFSWVQVCTGLELLDPKQYKHAYSTMDRNFMDNLYTWCLTKQKNYINQSMNHKEFIDFMLNEVS